MGKKEDQDSLNFTPLMPLHVIGSQKGRRSGGEEEEGEDGDGD